MSESKTEPEKAAAPASDAPGATKTAPASPEAGSAPPAAPTAPVAAPPAPPKAAAPAAPGKPEATKPHAVKMPKFWWKGTRYKTGDVLQLTDAEFAANKQHFIN